MLYSLYVKTHLITGLKYLGYTKQDPYIYRGSGTRWNNHIKIHGYNVWTNVILRSEDIYVIQKIGKELSELWDVTVSNDWANLKPEEGQGGSIKHTPEAIEKIKNCRAKQKITKETRNKFSARCSKSKWFNNGLKEKFTIICPEGWVFGRIFRNRKPKNSPSHLKETVYYNDGVRNYRVNPEKARTDWKRGMIPRSH